MERKVLELDQQLEEEICTQICLVVMLLSLENLCTQENLLKQ